MLKFTESDRNWDARPENETSIEWTFTLAPSDRKQVLVALSESLQAAGRKVSVTEGASGGAEGFEITEETQYESGDPQNARVQVEQRKTWVAFPNEIAMRRVMGSKVEVMNGAVLKDAGFADTRETILKIRPRVELFVATEQLMDVITLQELDAPQQEFMQGIFRYAGIWSEHSDLFRQTPATEHRLMRASEDFTQRIRRDWQQGENLTFRLSHAGKDGDRIQLLIGDPAVGGRFVRPSERSEGFSTFFKMSMRLLARTSSSPASSYIFLFDEPGTALHPAGQVNLQRVFERLSDDNQIVYATHSLFMINHNRMKRNRVVSKGAAGTQVDQKPYLKNWRAVRDSLGLILAGTFFIADRTLLVEGESDAMYITALLGAFDRAGQIDVDLNLFSVQWAGNARDFAPMARLLLEEGREVVAIVDGDEAGKRLKQTLDRLNAQIAADQSTLKPVVVVSLPEGSSTEDLLPNREEYFKGVVAAGDELLTAGFRQPTQQDPADRNARLAQLGGDRAGRTLGRHVEDVTRNWFNPAEPISKVMIARNYVSWLEGCNVEALNPGQPSGSLRTVVQELRLGSKQSDAAVLGQ